MIVLGVILLLLGALFEVPAVVTTIGIILIVVGALMMLLGAMGRPVGPRRYYW
ncbi:MAG TPA: DUF6131 family protein [Egibacteraceae bacterium]|nr:DUF6131 family protein [Egibacteraceae bacterium]